jgi:GntR family transcriptional regulator, vanillate catabolism transcriptional regulator
VATRGVSVTNNIREAILSGDHPGGARLNEVDLATALDVSRTPVRAALSTLAAEGLLEYRPNSGYIVRTYTPRDIAGIYEVRATLEGLAARLVAERGLSDGRRAALHKVLEDTEQLLKRGAWHKAARARWAELNDRFHGTLLEAAENAHLALMLRKSREIPLINQLKFRWYDIRSAARAHEDHRDVFNALVDRQAARAEALSREHIHKSGQRIVDNWRKIEARKLHVAGRPRAA